MNRYQRWLEKLDALRAADPTFRVFGASTHRYELNAPLSEERLAEFEQTHHVTLPEHYRGFLRFCGNGGAGPYYGVFPLGLFDGAGSGLEPWRPGDGFAGILCESFPHTAAWNLPQERLVGPSEFESDEAEDAWIEALDLEYWSPDLTNGAFPIGHQGCAYRDLLVVCGDEYGNVWLDGRASDGGIAPEPDGSSERFTFADWYEGWLDEALAGGQRL